nr:EOG090X0P1V [Moina brachiata]
MEYEAVVKGPIKFKQTVDSDIKKKKKKKNKEKVKEVDSSKSSEQTQNSQRRKTAIVKTKAQLKFEQMKEEQLKKRILEKASKTHKQRVEEFNRHLDNLTEHFDIPKSRHIASSSRRLEVSVAQPAILKTPENITDQANPLDFPDYFGVRKLFTVKDLFDARVHLGHREGTLDPNMKPYLFGSRLGHLIFDLDVTAEHLQDALNFTAHIAHRGGIILFVSHNPKHTLTIEKTAAEAGEYAHAREWNSFLFTNSEKIYQGVTRLPDLLILLSTLNPLMQEHTAVRDAAKLCIPTVGIVDTNSNPNLITYPVPGNDDSPSSIELYCKLFKEAILLGKSKRSQPSL